MCGLNEIYAVGVHGVCGSDGICGWVGYADGICGWDETAVGMG